jgi:tryptophan-rich sensory protein
MSDDAQQPSEVRNPNSRKRDIAGLIGWVLLCFSASATAAFVDTGGWYAELNKPSWNPPSWLFGPVWTTLYVMMGVSAWLVWRKGGWKSMKGPLSLFVFQWVLNAIWTPLFFGIHRPDLAFFEIILLWAAIVATIVVFWKISRVASILLLPYLLWVSFASFLNFTIWKLNPGP